VKGIAVKVLGVVALVALVAVLVLWFAQIDGGRDFLRTVPGMVLAAIAAVGVLVFGTGVAEQYIEQNGPLQALGLLLVTVAVGAGGYAFNRWSGYISGLATLAQVIGVLAAVAAVCYPLGLVMYLLRRRGRRFGRHHRSW
jgi:hypothetical protein